MIVSGKKLKAIENKQFTEETLDVCVDRLLDMVLTAHDVTKLLIVRKSDVRCCERTVVSHRLLLDRKF